ncbi:unnamed protein product [Rotaria sordida]|uniref:Uncharacterized protein n=1 Tax=Rotaria sordida TaxID=392033 RepID=A0A818QN63_9BILA|nr:unnamed protein product [Rotaria sordida]CAF3638268.1 unnamed protein product [Rotaria sordida]CAF3641296.1 unnamed protein product [Rotaria sordida]
MFAVPEVDDNIEISIPIETTKSITQPEATIESSISPPSPPSASLVEQIKKNPIKMPIPPATVSSKQHHSRRSLFHRNTIHICDQIVDRM